jgi:hypothetical protein
MAIRKKQPGLTRRASKEIRQLAKEAMARGWSVETLGSGHIRFTKPGRKALVTGPTSTDWRTIKNLLAAIEREQDE